MRTHTVAPGLATIVEGTLAAHLYHHLSLTELRGRTAPTVDEAAAWGLTVEEAEAAAELAIAHLLVDIAEWNRSVEG